MLALSPKLGQEKGTPYPPSIRCGREAGGRNFEPSSLGAETRYIMRTTVGAEGLQGRIASQYARARS